MNSKNSKSQSNRILSGTYLVQNWVDDSSHLGEVCRVQIRHQIHRLIIVEGERPQSWHMRKRNEFAEFIPSRQSVPSDLQSLLMTFCMFPIGITIGIMATTRSSQAGVSHVVHPLHVRRERNFYYFFLLFLVNQKYRLEAPAMANLESVPKLYWVANCTITSIAIFTDLT